MTPILNNLSSLLMYSFPLLPHIYSTRKAGGKDFDIIFSPTNAQLSGGEKEKDLKMQLKPNN